MNEGLMLSVSGGVGKSRRRTKSCIGVDDLLTDRDDGDEESNVE
jgi:hypothetical protein